jgi:hypothetical protein
MEWACRSPQILWRPWGSKLATISESDGRGDEEWEALLQAVEAARNLHIKPLMLLVRETGMRRSTVRIEGTRDPCGYSVASFAFF